MLHIRRTLTGVGYLGIAVALVTGVNPILAVAHPPATNAAQQTYTDPQPPSKADFSGHGANTHGPYDSTRSGAPSLNGNGGGQAVGKPCAGCVGKADNKNPQGQMPNGSDNNAGYECDRNHGIGRTNPAHTGCTSTTPPPCDEATEDCGNPPPCDEATEDCGNPPPCDEATEDCGNPPPCDEATEDCGNPPPPGCVPTAANNFCTEVLGEKVVRTTAP